MSPSELTDFATRYASAWSGQKGDAMRAIWNGEVIAESDTTVGGEENHDAAWYYPDPQAAAMEIKDRIAFRRGVTVTESGEAG